MPALPLHEAGKYVAGAYIVFFALILIYVSIMATRLSRIQRELGELLAIAERRRRTTEDPGPAGSAAAGGRLPAGDASVQDVDEPVGVQPR